MKEELQSLTDKEAELKAQLETANVQKQKCQERCAQTKENIKANREKFKK